MFVLRLINKSLAVYGVVNLTKKMDVNELVILISALGGIEGIKWAIRAWVNRKTDARKEDATADRAEIDNATSVALEWKGLYEKKESKVNELNGKIDRLYVQIEEGRERNRQIQAENFQLQLRVQALEFIKCNKALTCIDRDPPNEYIKKVTNLKLKEDESK